MDPIKENPQHQRGLKHIQVTLDEQDVNSKQKDRRHIQYRFQT
jgi:hypothetical protein